MTDSLLLRLPFCFVFFSSSRYKAATLYLRKCTVQFLNMLLTNGKLTAYCLWSMVQITVPEARDLFIVTPPLLCLIRLLKITTSSSQPWCEVNPGQPLDGTIGASPWLWLCAGVCVSAQEWSSNVLEFYFTCAPTHIVLQLETLEEKVSILSLVHATFVSIIYSRTIGWCDQTASACSQVIKCHVWPRFLHSSYCHTLSLS